MEHDPEPDGSAGVRCESIRIGPARDGWVEVATTGSCFLSPERAREAVAAVWAALGEEPEPRWLWKQVGWIRGTDEFSATEPRGVGWRRVYIMLTAAEREAFHAQADDGGGRD